MTDEQRAALALFLAAESDAELRLLLEEVNTLRAENRDLRADNAALRERVEAALERGRMIRAHRPKDIRGLLALAREAINGRK